MSEYVYDCYDIDEPSTIWDEKRVRARKTHSCCECGHPIVVGEEHVRIKSLFDGSWDTYRVCVCCDKARCAVAEAYSRGEFQACIPMGELRAAIREGLEEGWLTQEQVDGAVTGGTG